MIRETGAAVVFLAMPSAASERIAELVARLERIGVPYFFVPSAGELLLSALQFGEVAGEKWLTLLPKKWNPPHQVVYGWRYDPRELSASAAAPTRDQRRRNATRMDED